MANSITKLKTNLWQGRTILFALLVAAVLGNMIYFLPQNFWFWVVVFFCWLFLAVFWWQRKLDWIFWRELLEVFIFTLAFLGISIFAVRSLMIFELVLAIYLWALWYVALAFRALRQEGSFRVKDLARLYWGELVAFFFALVGILSATVFLGLGMWVAMLLLALLTAVIFYLFADRNHLEKKFFWFYLSLLLVILFEFLFVVFPWQRGVFFKAFLLFIVYFLYVEFIRHYLAGNLTFRLVLAQLFFALVLLLALFLFDFVFVLI